MGQFIRNPAIQTKGLIGLSHEILPAYIGTPAFYGGATIGAAGIVYGSNYLLNQ